MAAANRRLNHGSSLTAEERRFIVEVLLAVELRGNSKALRRAVELIDSITEKLTADIEEGRQPEKS